MVPATPFRPLPVDNRSANTPPMALIYGLLGVLPFAAPAVVGVVAPSYRNGAAVALVVYAGLILSFLGGARWGLAVSRDKPSPGTISLAMLPTLGALALLLLPAEHRRVQILGLAVALAMHWLWDITAGGLPVWYPRLRSILTTGAEAGLIAGGLVLT